MAVCEAPAREYVVHLRDSSKHPKQDAFIKSRAKRIAIKAGRRGGKTVGIAQRAVKRFLEGRRQLYGAPTTEQVARFWFEVCRALAEPIAAGLLRKDETEHIIEVKGTEQRIRAKTCWNAQTLRGDYADDLYLDEWQLMAEDTWSEVGAPMLMDNNGDAVFIHTPPSLASSGVCKANDPRHASKQFKEALADPRWETFHFTSYDNPYLAEGAVEEIAKDMSSEAFRREILAQDDEIEQSWLVYGKLQPYQFIKRSPIDKSWFIYSGHDFGKANPAALFAAQNPGTGDFFLYREWFPGGGKSAHEHVMEFQEITKGYNVIRRVGGNLTSEADNRSLYTSHGWPIVEPKMGQVSAQIDRVHGMMNLNKIFIFDDLLGLKRELNNCMWKRDDENKPTNEIEDEKRYHFLACLRYMFSYFTPETADPDRMRVYHPR